MSAETSSKNKFAGAPTSEGGYLLAIAAAAEAAASQELQIVTSGNEVSATFDYFAYNPRLADVLLVGDLKERTWPERAMAVACRAGLLSGAPRVDFESWNGQVGVRWRLTSDSVKDEILSKSPWKGGAAASRFVVRFRTGLKRELFRVGGSDEMQAAVALLTERAKHSGVRVTVDGEDINQTIRLGKGVMQLVLNPKKFAQKLPSVSCRSHLKREQESRGSYFGHFLFGGEESSSFVICRGLQFPVALPLADELGFSGVVIAHHLTTDPELNELVENSDFDDLLNDVETDILGGAADLIDVVGEIEDSELEPVLETLDLVVETHRAGGEIEEAVAVLQRMVAAPKLPVYARASHLTQLARMLERADRAEESFDFYNSALDYWGQVDGDHQDLELVATALLGAARLMSIYDADPETAIDYTQRALALRRSVSDEDDPERGVAAELLGRLYLKHKRYPAPEFVEVEPLLQEALKSYQQNYGKTHNTVATILQNLGEFHRLRGSFDEAEGYYLKALAIREKLLGSKSEQVGEIFDRLAAVFETEGDIQKAGQYYFRSLEVWEHLLGPTHPDVVERVNDLVVLYRVYGHFEKAEPLYTKLLKLKEGDGSAPPLEAVPDLCALALFYQVQEKYGQAEPLLQKALSTLEEHYGADANHPDLAWVHGLSGRFFDEQYRFKKAEEHLLKSLLMTEVLLGDLHPDLIVCLEVLARHYRVQKRYFEAMECAERALAIAEQFYGTQHPYVATSLNTYAELLCASGEEQVARGVYLAAYEIHETSANILLSPAAIPKPEKSRLASVRQQAEQLHVQAVEPAREYSRFAEAESLYLKALFLREQVLGPDHFDNARTLQLLAELYRNHRRYEGAESLYKRSLSVRQTHLGPTHPDCALSLRALTETLLLQDKRSEAEPLLAQWLEIVERTLGQNHSERAEILVRMASILEAQDKRDEQLRLLEEAVTIRHGVFGTEHPTFAVTLAEMLRVEGKSVQASELYDFVLTSLEKNLGTDDAILIPILENYAEVLTASGREELAAGYETRAMVMRVEHGLDFG